MITGHCQYWLEFQDCAGDTEALLRASSPSVSELVLDVLSLDYHETLFAAAGHQAEAALKSAMALRNGTVGSVTPMKLRSPVRMRVCGIWNP